MYFSSFSPQSSPKGNSYIFCFPRIPMAPSKKKEFVVRWRSSAYYSYLPAIGAKSHFFQAMFTLADTKNYPVQNEHLYIPYGTLHFIEIGTAQHRALAPSPPRALAPSRPRALAPSRPRVFSPKSPFLHVCEQKPYLVWFSFQLKSYPVQCEHNLSLVECEFLISLSTNLCSARMDRR